MRVTLKDGRWCEEVGELNENVFGSLDEAAAVETATKGASTDSLKQCLRILCEKFGPNEGMIRDGSEYEDESDDAEASGGVTTSIVRAMW
jgi:hypothetical protein